MPENNLTDQVGPTDRASKHTYAEENENTGYPVVGAHTHNGRSHGEHRACSKLLKLQQLPERAWDALTNATDGCNDISQLTEQHNELEEGMTDYTNMTDYTSSGEHITALSRQRW